MDFARFDCYTEGIKRRSQYAKGAVYMTLGQRIAQKRKELGLSQEALGDQLGLSRQSIYKWESDLSLT